MRHAAFAGKIRMSRHADWFRKLAPSDAIAEGLAILDRIADALDHIADETPTQPRLHPSATWPDTKKEEEE